MKQRLLTIVGIVLCFSLGLASSSMAITSQEKAFIDRLFEAAGVTKSTNNDAKELKNLAKDEEAPFENLYLFMYENIKRGPHDAAIADLAIREDYTEKQLEAIVLEGETGKIIERKQEIAAEAAAENAMEDREEAIESYEETVDGIVGQLEGLVPEEIIQDLENIYGEYGPEELTQKDLSTVYTHSLISDEYARIMDLYNEELERQRENRKLSYMSISKEIFMNGDLSDSANIDILYEFDLIHYLFFGEFMVMPDRSIPATERSINQVGDDGETADLGSDVILASELLPSPGIMRSMADAKAQGSEFDVTEILLAEEIDESLDPYTCFDDEELREALEAFEQEDEIADTGSNGNNNGSSESTGSNDSYDYDPADYEGEDDEAEVLSNLDNFAGQLGGSGADWSRSLPCNDVFCITIDLITENGDATKVETTENHIFAHVSYINQRMEETMAKSLVPGKVSMNWFEDATCKEAGLLVNLDLNVEAIAVPIDLDPGDDIDEKAAADVSKFQEELRIAAQEDPNYQCGAILNYADFQVYEGAASISEFLGRCQDLEAQYEAELKELFDRFIVETSTQANSTLFEQMKAELGTFLLYIQQFEASLKKSVEPLTNTFSKKTCQ